MNARKEYYLKILLAGLNEVFLAVNRVATKVDGCFASQQVVDEFHEMQQLGLQRNYAISRPCIIT